jgi:hypothetical protein
MKKGNELENKWDKYYKTSSYQQLAIRKNHNFSTKAPVAVSQKLA